MRTTRGFKRKLLQTIYIHLKFAFDETAVE